jgi:hypothetical protein
VRCRGLRCPGVPPCSTCVDFMTMGQLAATGDFQALGRPTPDATQSVPLSICQRRPSRLRQIASPLCRLVPLETDARARDTATILDRRGTFSPFPLQRRHSRTTARRGARMASVLGSVRLSCHDLAPWRKGGRTCCKFETVANAAPRTCSSGQPDYRHAAIVDALLAPEHCPYSQSHRASPFLRIFLSGFRGD